MAATEEEAAHPAARGGESATPPGAATRSAPTQDGPVSHTCKTLRGLLSQWWCLNMWRFFAARSKVATTARRQKVNGYANFIVASPIIFWTIGVAFDDEPEEAMMVDGYYIAALKY